MAPRKEESKRGRTKKEKQEDPEEPFEDYRKKRDRNNQAVKRSRVKSKMKMQETLARVSQLKNENNVLEDKVNKLQKELGLLKELFLAHAGSGIQKFDSEELERLLSEDPS